MAISSSSAAWPAVVVAAREAVAVGAGVGAAACGSSLTVNKSNEGSPGDPASSQVAAEPSRNAPSPSPSNARVCALRRAACCEAVANGSAMVPFVRPVVRLAAPSQPPRGSWHISAAKAKSAASRGSGAARSSRQPSPAAAAMRGPSAASATALRAMPQRSHSAAK
jgi:hypothetical protein